MNMLRRYAVRVYYDGSGFHGFQPQKDKRTVGGEIIVALMKSKLAEDPSALKFQASSRTDKGASALSQTVAFTTHSAFSPQRLNVFLPEEIRVWAWAEVPIRFNETSRTFLLSRLKKEVCRCELKRVCIEKIEKIYT